jgi:predicted MPP superfamily phosphohydrolase
MAYGAVEAYRIRVETLTMYSSRLPATSSRIRIVQISDVHLGPMLYPRRLTPIIAAIEQAQPDILVCSGDLIDGPLMSPSLTAAAFSKLTAPLGKYAVTGNHEFYCGIDRASEFIRDAGFTLLRNRTVTAGNQVAITGIDDPTGGRDTDQPTEAQLAAGMPKNRFSLLLKHRPLIDPATKGVFDLQLSGHTHQGQIFPFGLLIRLFYPLDHGWHRVGDHGGLYTSRGTGTWGPPIRILAPPEITVIDILPKKK